MTFPRSVGQVPIYYNAKNTGRPLSTENTDKCNSKNSVPIIWMSATHRLSFWVWISYTYFGYSDVSVTNAKPSGNTSIEA